MSGHTKGPWQRDGQTVYALDFINGGTRNRFDARVTGYFDNRDRTESEANARLIAAAPELLDALKRCAELLDDYSDVVDGDDGQPRPNRAMSLLQDVEAVIRKAEGK